MKATSRRSGQNQRSEAGAACQSPPRIAVPRPSTTSGTTQRPRYALPDGCAERAGECSRPSVHVHEWPEVSFVHAGEDVELMPGGMVRGRTRLMNHVGEFVLTA